MEDNKKGTKPTWNKGTPFCGKCGHRLEKKNRVFDGWKCPKCKEPVKWN